MASQAENALTALVRAPLRSPSRVRHARRYSPDGYGNPRIISGGRPTASGAATAGEEVAAEAVMAEAELFNALLYRQLGPEPILLTFEST